MIASRPADDCGQLHLGGGAGYLVAQQNTQAANKEDALRARIAAAQDDITRFDRIITTTNGVIAHHRQAIAVMKASYKKQETALTSARQERSNLTGDIQSVQKALTANEERVSAISSDIPKFGSGGARLAVERDELLKQQAILREQLRKLLGIEESVPTS